MFHLTSEHEEGDRGIITHKGEILFSNPDVMEHILNWLDDSHWHAIECVSVLEMCCAMFN